MKPQKRAHFFPTPKFKAFETRKSVFYVTSFTRAFISNINSATRDSEEKQSHQNAAEILTRPKTQQLPKWLNLLQQTKKYCEFVPNTVRLPDCNVYRLNDTTNVPTVKNKRKLLVQTY